MIINLGFASVDNHFLRVNILTITLSGMQYLYITTRRSWLKEASALCSFSQFRIKGYNVGWLLEVIFFQNVLNYYYFFFFFFFFFFVVVVVFFFAIFVLEHDV